MGEIMMQTTHRSIKVMRWAVNALYLLLLPFSLMGTGCGTSPKVTWSFHAETAEELEKATSMKPMTDWISDKKLTGRLVVNVYDDKTVPVFDGSFVDGVQNGKSATWYPNGNLCMTAEYNNGLFHGVRNCYYEENGKLYISVVYSNGVQIGNIECWHPNGEKMQSDEMPKSINVATNVP